MIFLDLPIASPNVTRASVESNKNTLAIQCGWHKIELKLRQCKSKAIGVSTKCPAIVSEQR